MNYPPRVQKISHVKFSPAPSTHITVTVKSHLRRPQRREILGAILKTFKEAFTHLSHSHIYDEDGSLSLTISQFIRTPSLRCAAGITTPEQKIGFEIRMLRLAQALSQQDLAKKIGTPRCYISKIERGKTKITPKMNQRLQHVLNKNGAKLN